MLPSGRAMDPSTVVAKKATNSGSLLDVDVEANEGGEGAAIVVLSDLLCFVLFCLLHNQDSQKYSEKRVSSRWQGFQRDTQHFGSTFSLHSSRDARFYQVQLVCFPYFRPFEGYSSK